MTNTLVNVTMALEKRIGLRLDKLIDDQGELYKFKTRKNIRKEIFRILSEDQNNVFVCSCREMFYDSEEYNEEAGGSPEVEASSWAASKLTAKALKQIDEVRVLATSETEKLNII
jgi:hypothetical protein